MTASDQYDTDAEDRLLGVLIKTPKVVLEDPVHRGLFSGERLDVFDAIKAVRGAAGKVTPSSVVMAVNNLPATERDGLEATLTTLAKRYGDDSYDPLCDRLEDLRLRRVVMAASKKAYDSVRDGDPSEALLELEEAVVGARRGDEGWSDCRDTDDLVKEIQWRMDNPGAIKGLPTGFPGIDAMLDGLCPEELVVVASRPSIGKSALATNFITHLVKNQVKVGLFTLEMSEIEVKKRVVSLLSGVPVNRDLHKQPGRGLNKVMDGVARLAQFPLWIDDTSGLSLDQFKSRSSWLKEMHGVDLIVVDYLQLMKSPAERRDIEIANCTGAAKQMAKRLGIPVVMLSQLNRKADTVYDKDIKGYVSLPPRLSDLRESGAIEQDADTVLFIHREINDLEGELIVAKQRKGPTGSIKVNYNPELTRFSEQDPEDIY